MRYYIQFGKFTKVETKRKERGRIRLHLRRPICRFLEFVKDSIPRTLFVLGHDGIERSRARMVRHQSNIPGDGEENV